jgi:hypothetical protein
VKERNKERRTNLSATTMCFRKLFPGVSAIYLTARRLAALCATKILEGFFTMIFALPEFEQK